MTRIRKPARWLLLLAALALFATACGGGDGDGDDVAPGAGEGASPAAEGESEAAAGGAMSAYICEPQFLSPPSNITESCGAEVANALYTPLVQVDFEASQTLLGPDEPNAVAESIETEDNTVFTITLKDGWTMHNGEPLTAQNYVDAWNYGAYGPNANTGGYFFAQIEGYEDLQCADTDDEGNCQGEPEVTEMTGLEVIDDLTFQVTLTEAFSVFPLALNYTAFHPVPSDFMDDPEPYVEAPVGNGPFMMDGEWQHNQSVSVTRYADFPGEVTGNVSDVEYRIYSEIDTAYNDLLAGNLDMMDAIPAAQLEAAEQQFGDRFVNEPSTTITYMGYPTFDDNYADPDVRKALSMAIDREAITQTVRPDFTPLGGFVPPDIPGALSSGCDGNCEFNLEEAQRLWEESGGIDGTVTIWFNTGADHETWTEAVANQWRQNLGIEDIQFESFEFAEYLGLLAEQEITGPYRLGWIPDYPSPHTYLASLYGTDASSNYTGYSNENFDEQIAQGEQAATPEESVPFFQDAERQLNEDMPGIPLFTTANLAAWSERLSGVEVGFFDEINVDAIMVSE